MNVAWSPKATQEFEAQVSWLEENLGRRQATRYLQEVMTALEKITNPQAAYQLIRVDPEIRCYPVNRTVKLYCRPLPQAVELISFFDTRQDPGKLNL